MWGESLQIDLMTRIFTIKNRRQGNMAQKVAKVGIKKESGWLYFVDKKGDISRA